MSLQIMAEKIDSNKVQSAIDFLHSEIDGTLIDCPPLEAERLKANYDNIFLLLESLKS